MERMISCAIYVRVSTEEQARTGYSIPDQISRLKQFALEKDWDIEDFYVDDGYSAKNLNRPALKRLLEAILQDRVDVLLIADVDRLSRSIRDQEHIKDLLRAKQVELWKPYERYDIQSADGDFTVSLLGILAQRERKKTAERVHRAMRKRAEKGLWNGGDPPYGYTSRKRLIREALAKGLDEKEALRRAMRIAPEEQRLYVDEEESKTVALIFNLYLDEEKQLGFGKIAEYLNTHGYRTRVGKLWHTSVVRELVANPIYSGLIRWNRLDCSSQNRRWWRHQENEVVLVKGVQPAIIEPEKWQQAQAKRERNRSQSRGRSDYLLSGIMFCGRCGSPMVGTSEGRKGSWRGYRCTGRRNFGSSFCPFGSMNKQQIEEAVLRDVEKIIVHPECVREALEATNQELMDHIPDITRKLKEKEQEIAELKTRMLRWYDAFEQSILEPTEFRERVGQLKERLTEAEAEYEELQSQLTGRQMPSVSYEEVEVWLTEFRDHMEVGLKKELLRSLGTRITVLDNQRVQMSYSLYPSTKKQENLEDSPSASLVYSNGRREYPPAR